MEKINVQFDELTLMAFKQDGSGPDLQGLTSGQISSGLVLNQAASTSTKPPTKDDWDFMFQLMFDEYFKNPSIASNPISATTLPPPDTTKASFSFSTSIDKDAPSLSTLPNIKTTNTSLNSTNVKPNEEVAEFDSDTFTNPFVPLDTSSAVSSSRIVDTSNMHTFQKPPIYTKRWTKDHLLVIIIGDSSKPISTRRQLSTDALWCYFQTYTAFCRFATTRVLHFVLLEVAFCSCDLVLRSDSAFWFCVLLIVDISCVLPKEDSAHISCVLPKEDSARFKTWLRFVLRLGCVLSQRLPAFCLKTSFVLSQDLVAFCLKTSCVLSQDLLRFVSRLGCVLS
nr:hypothetical protein [Tanacetum cinerariifolium]